MAEREPTQVGEILALLGKGTSFKGTLAFEGRARVDGKLELTVTLSRVMMPFLLIASLTAVAMGMQYAHEQYTAPALSPATFNLVAKSYANLLRRWAEP